LPVESYGQDASDIVCQNGTLVRYYDQSFLNVKQRQARFSCRAACNAPSGIDKSADVPCQPNPVPSGSICLARCVSGYYPTSNGSAVSPLCSDGVLTPPVFECTAYSTTRDHRTTACQVRSLVTTNSMNAPCDGLGSSGLVGDSTKCVPQCEDGFEPDVDELTCQEGYWKPDVFNCHRESIWWTVLKWGLLALLMCCCLSCTIFAIYILSCTDDFLKRFSFLFPRGKRKSTRVFPDSDEEHRHRHRHHHRSHHGSHHGSHRHHDVQQAVVVREHQSLPALQALGAEGRSLWQKMFSSRAPQPQSVGLDHPIVDDPTGGERSYLLGSQSPGARPTDSVPPNAVTLPRRTLDSHSGFAASGSRFAASGVVYPSGTFGSMPAPLHGHESFHLRY